MVGGDLALLEERRDRTVGDAAMRDAFADGVYLGVVGLQRVVDYDAAVAPMTGWELSCPDSTRPAARRVAKTPDFLIPDDSRLSGMR